VKSILFARYEASNFGSRHIETEHLLLGLLREGHGLRKWFPGDSNAEPEIRAEIEKRMPRKERISTSVEIPLTEECKRVLNLAMEAANRLGHQQVELDHLLMGILGIEGSPTAQTLIARGLKSEPILEQFARGPRPKKQHQDTLSGSMRLESFLSGLKSLNSEELISFFARNAQFIDTSGKRWNRDEIWKGFDTLFAPYGKKNASYAVETIVTDSDELFVATVRWNNALLASEQRAWMHRMSIALVREANDWEILLAQVTPVDLSTSRQAS
jgi:hypothetical protein